MLFNSWEFLILLGVVFALYYLPVSAGAGKLWQVTLLLVGSGVFYAWENPRLLALLAGSCLVNAVAVERILFHKRREAEGSEGRRSGDPSKRWLVATVAANLGLLAFFKYAGFFAGLLPAGLVSETSKHWFADIPLPVGISFYTFQGISLVVDAWRGEMGESAARRFAASGGRRIGSIRDASFYISFFPQLIAGPIVKARDFVGQIGAKDWRDIDWSTVRACLIGGYFLKIFVADNLAEQTAALTLGPEILESMGPLILLSLLYSYSLQIFADFAGYSLIAIGLGALFGYRLPENFRFPYLSRSITEFWKRWHLTLSAWLRDYLYIPLGGNRRGRGRTYVNLMLVMLLGGLWHGAATKFVAWGMLHGILLATERALYRRAGRTGGGMGGGSIGRLARGLLGWLYAFHAVTFLWLSFLMPDAASIVAFFRGLAGPVIFSGPPLFGLVMFGSAAVLYHLWGWLVEHRGEWAGVFRRPEVLGLLHGAMLFLVLTNPGAPRGFIYFQF